MTKTAIDLAREVLELAEKATPGPWKLETGYEDDLADNEDPAVYVSSPLTFCDLTVVATMGSASYVPMPTKRSDAAFIAHSRNSAPAIAAQLISVQERLEKACELLKRQQEELRLIRLKDCAAVYDVCVRSEAAALLQEQSQ